VIPAASFRDLSVSLGATAVAGDLSFSRCIGTAAAKSAFGDLSQARHRWETPTVQEGRQFFMSDNQGETQDGERPNHVDLWVQSQLSAQHLQWLEKQKEVVDPTEILKFALAEWVIRHPEKWFGHASVAIAIRSALEEFIARHKEEFISTE
jgi:hypothetical protein